MLIKKDQTVKEVKKGASSEHQWKLVLECRIALIFLINILWEIQRIT